MYFFKVWKQWHLGKDFDLGEKPFVKHMLVQLFV